MIAKPDMLGPALYLVATPIGNARDITLRALDVLKSADVLAAEDTRTLRKLLEIHGIPLDGRAILAYHDHSGEAARAKIVRHIEGGKSVAYASEAGTPMVADPGYRLVRDLVEVGLPVVAIPGVSAALAAISVAGLPSDRFTFAGFAPTQDGARRRFLQGFSAENGTLIFYESPRRVEKFLNACAEVFGGDRKGALCRELTKAFEEVRRGTLAELAQDPGVLKGEMVVVVGPPAAAATPDEEIVKEALRRALETQSVRDAAAEVAAELGLNKRSVYQLALSLKG